MLKQHSRIKWLKDGDRSTFFYHRVTSIRCTGNYISFMHIDGLPCNDMSIISAHTVEYYQDLFHAEYVPSEETLQEVSSIINPSILHDKYAMLTAIPNYNDIKQLCSIWILIRPHARWI